MRGTSSLDRLRPFAVEDRAVQLTWGALGAGELTVRVGDIEKQLPATGGSATFDGLEPDTTYAVEATGLRLGPVRFEVRTLAPPPGAELYRFATISDIHVGMDYFDVGRRMVDDAPPEDLHPLRCTRAALRELEAWGAQRVVLKGDVTEQGLPSQWRAAAGLLRTTDLPVEVCVGNHDRWTAESAAHAARDGDETPVDADEGAALAGIDLHRDVTWVDAPGVRLVLVETPLPGRHLGAIGPARTDATAAALRDAPSAVLLLHHQLQTTPVPTYWPPGVPRRDAARFLAAVRAAGRGRTLITSGHTHRHRRHDLGGVVATEVGSTKDYPGTWAGYAVHEGGIRQVVRRIEAPDCVAWLERTRAAALGRWGRWSPGTLDDRCFSHPWPG
jgi:predicted phosphodiesterase